MLPIILMYFNAIYIYVYTLTQYNSHHDKVLLIIDAVLNKKLPKTDLKN